MFPSLDGANIEQFSKAKKVIKIIEIQNPEQDGQLSVFHDYDLSMRTNGAGNISDYTMAELKQLDIGYGYTADGGKTFPFRGKGIGLMPEL